MKIKGITKRWLIYGLGLIMLLIVLLETVAAFAIHRWYYNGVEQTILSRSELMRDILLRITPLILSIWTKRRVNLSKL